MSSFQRIVKYVGMALAILLTVGIIGGICAAVFGITGSGKSKSSSESSIGSKSDVYLGDEFSSMDIEGGVADVEIKKGDSYRVETVDVPETLVVDVKSNGTLEIKEKDEWHDWFDWFDLGTWSKESKIYITVPEDFEADEIYISAGTGDITMSDLTTKTLDIDGGVGDVTGSYITAQKVTIDTGVGNVDFDQINFGDCDIDGGVGDITLNGVIQGDCDFDGGVGDMDITIDGTRDDFELDIESGVGSVRVNGETMDDFEENNNNKYELQIDGGVGAVTLDFTED